MLKPLKLKATDDLPNVVLDAKLNQFFITGRVLPEDGNKFFEPILNWISEYVETPNTNTEFRFRLDYYNSSTARMITKMIVLLEKIQEKDKNVKVVWEYLNDDEVMLERGEELKSISYLPFELRAVKKQ
jgi:hypothetical protein